MAVRGYDGVEHHGTSTSRMAQAGWIQIGDGSIISSDKRTGTYAWQFSNGGGGFRRNYEGMSATCSKAGLAMGWRFPSFDNPGNHCIMQWRNSSNRAHISLQVNGLGRIMVMRGGRDALSAPSTQIGISTKALVPNTWNHIEAEVLLHASAGHVKIRVNGKEFYYLEGVNTIGAISGNGFHAAFAFGSFDSSASSGAYADAKWDDCAWWDDEVDAHHDGSFIGQHGVTYLPANLDGTYEEWTPSSGVDSFAMVDDIEPDEDSTYISSDTIGQRAAFGCATPPANVEDIECLAVVARVKKTDTGDADISLGVITLGATEDSLTQFAVTSDYHTYYGLYPINPETAAAWNPVAMPEVLVTNEDPSA